MNNDGDIYRAWVNIKESVQTSARESLGLHESKQHNPWFDAECLGFFFCFKQAKRQWMEDPSQRNLENLNKVRRDASRHLRNENKAYMKAKIEELKSNNKFKM
jgi:hypothetical protein